MYRTLDAGLRLLLIVAVLVCSMTLVRPEPARAVAAELVGSAALAAFAVGGAAYYAAHPNATLGEVAYNLGTSTKSLVVANAMLQVYAAQHGLGYSAAGRGWGDAATVYQGVVSAGPSAVAAWDSAMAGMTTADDMMYANVAALWGLLRTPEQAAIAGTAYGYPEGKTMLVTNVANNYPWNISDDSKLVVQWILAHVVYTYHAVTATTGTHIGSLSVGTTLVRQAPVGATGGVGYGTWTGNPTACDKVNIDQGLIDTVKALLVAQGIAYSLSAGTAAVAVANIGWDSGIAVPGTVAVPASAVNAADLTDAVTAPYPNGASPMMPPPAWAIPLTGTVAGLSALAESLRALAATLAANLAGLGTIGFGLDQLLAWLLAPVQAVLNAFAAILDWLGSWAAHLFNLVIPTEAQFNQQFQQQFKDIKDRLPTLWPFAVGPLVALLVATAQDVGDGVGNGTLAVSWSFPYAQGRSVNLTLVQLMSPIEPYRWVLVGGVWILLFMGCVRLLRPQVAV